MKWPNSLTLIRHDTSTYNALRVAKLKDGLYQEFIHSYNQRPWTEETIRLAHEVRKKFSLTHGDHDTPLITDSGNNAKIVGKSLAGRLPLPDVIYVSPYLRTKQTLTHLQQGWTQLKTVKVIEDERLREQDHGLLLSYNDWRVFNVLHQEQAHLRKIQTRYWYRYPQGENIADLRLRVRSWFSTLIRDHANQEVVVVAHHLTILAIRANFERLSAKEFIDLNEQESLHNAGVTIYRGDPRKGSNGQMVLEAYNLKLYDES